MTKQSSAAEATSIIPHLKIAAVWALVTVPALWGLIETLHNAVTLLTR